MPTETRTFLTNVINPEVMADMVSAQLPKALQVSRLYKVDTTLTGKAGNTITVPRWAYIGAAADLNEGATGTITQMTTTDVDYTVKKAVKNVELTDEALLSGYGDPQGEAVRQLRMAIADKVDDDGVALLTGIASTDTGALYVSLSTQAALDYTGVCEGLDKLGEEQQGGTKVLLVDQQGIKDLRTDTRFVDKYSDEGTEMMASGVVGRIAGCDVVISNKLNPASGTAHKAFICKIDPETGGPLTAFIKRDVNVESARNILTKTTTISADEHYVVALEDISKVVVLTWDTSYAPAAAAGGEG